MLFLSRPTVIRKLLMLVCLSLAPLMMPEHGVAQVLDANLPTPIRTAHSFKQDFIHDKPFQYSPCDPFERGKIFRMHTGHWGKYYNCDDEEAKRCSPYIYWKTNDKPALPGHLGPLQAIRCECLQVKQRILDGSCAKCQKCGEAGCACCDDVVARACSTCDSEGCRGCGGKRNVSCCDDGTCGTCRDCRSREYVKRRASRSQSTCATGDCGNCRQCALAAPMTNAGAQVDSGCGSEDCGQCTKCSRAGRGTQRATQTTSACGDCGQCSKCSQRGRSNQVAAQSASACNCGDSGQCRECKSRRPVGNRIGHKKCAKCAPEGFRGPRTACAREGNCGNVDTCFDAMAPAGLIYYQRDPRDLPSYPADPGMEPGYPSDSGAEAPSVMGQFSKAKPAAPSVTAQSNSSASPTAVEKKNCNCAECRLAKARHNLKMWNDQQQDKLQR